MNRFAGLTLTAAISASATLVGIGCQSSPTPSKPAAQATLASETTASLDGFKNEDPSLAELLDKAVGYAVFPDVGKAGFIAGGSYGKGELFEGGKKTGFADITQATIGLQAGAQSFGELVLFMRDEDLQKFKRNDFALSGNLSAVAIKAGAARSADTSKGVVVFVRSKSGLMAEASVGGQRFRFQPIAEKAAATTQPS
jgi:lipid-binding SYLF domain-containing protein